MTSSPHIEAGALLVYRGQGLVRVDGSREIEGRAYWVLTVVDGGMSIALPADAPPGILRDPVSRATAERLAAQLALPTGAADERRWAVRFHETMVALVNRSLEEQVTALHRLYRAAYAPTFGERRLIGMLEGPIIGELAHVLGRDRASMIAELHAGQPAFAANAPPRPPEPAIAAPTAPVAIAGYDYLGALSSPSGRIAVGEVTAPAADVFIADGRPGEWHAYFADPTDSEDGHLLLIHAGALPQRAALLAKLVDVRGLDVEGGTVAMVSAEARDDEEFKEAAIFPITPIIERRGCVITTRGDGAHRLRAAKVGDQFAVLVVDY